MVGAQRIGIGAQKNRDGKELKDAKCLKNGERPVKQGSSHFCMLHGLH